MKLFSTIALICLSSFVFAQTTPLTPGVAAPAFNLKNVDGKAVSFDSYLNAKGYIVVFTCNTCPYAVAYEDRLVALDKKFAPLGYPVIAINPNDPEAQPADTYELMKDKSKERGFTFPYLYDPGQRITDAYGAQKTPHIFLVQRGTNQNMIVYTGAIDNDTDDVKADKTKYVEDAIAALQRGEAPAVASTKAIGCTVKRKKA